MLDGEARDRLTPSPRGEDVAFQCPTEPAVHRNPPAIEAFIGRSHRHPSPCGISSDLGLAPVTLKPGTIAAIPRSPPVVVCHRAGKCAARGRAPFLSSCVSTLAVRRSVTGSPVGSWRPRLSLGGATTHVRHPVGVVGPEMLRYIARLGRGGSPLVHCRLPPLCTAGLGLVPEASTAPTMHTGARRCKGGIR